MPWPKTLGPEAFRGPLQWALEGPGWTVLRRATDFTLLCVAVVVGLRTVRRTPVDSREA